MRKIARYARSSNTRYMYTCTTLVRRTDGNCQNCDNFSRLEEKILFGEKMRFGWFPESCAVLLPFHAVSAPICGVSFLDVFSELQNWDQCLETFFPPPFEFKPIFFQNGK